MRYPSIDILRTVAIVVMVLVHFGENLSGFGYPFAGLGAPLFTVLSGVSYYLWVKGQEARGKSDEEISKISIRRGLFVFGVGFAFNILVWLPEDTFNWDVLTFIGTALLLLNILRRVPLPISVLVGAMAVLVAPVLRAMADYPSYWEDGYFAPDWTLSDVLIGFTAAGYFPIFPWIAYTLCGFVTASLMFGVDRDSPEFPLWPLMLVGAALIATAALALTARPYLPAAFANHVLGGWTMFPASVEYMLSTIGMALLLFGLARRCVDRNPWVLKYAGLLSIAKTFSQYSLTIYVFHHVVHLWPMWIYAVATGYEPTYFWREALPITVSMPLSLLFLVVCYFLLRSIGPDRRFGIEGWMRWLCD